VKDTQQQNEEVEEFPDVQPNGNMFSMSAYPAKMCTPVPLSALNIKLSNKIRRCQICHYEMRPDKWKSVVFCSRHGVRLCTQRRDSCKDSEPTLVQVDGSPVTDWTWTHDSSLSCWEKFHQFYEPEGLFNKYFFVNEAEKKCKFSQCIYTSSLHQKKYHALGIEIRCKPGKSVGMGRIREDIHMGKRNTLPQSETDEDYIEDDIDENSTTTEENE